MAIYHQTLEFDFVSWDDNAFIYNNPYLDPVTPAHVAEFWKGPKPPYQYLYAPLAYTAWAAISAIDRGGSSSVHTRRFTPALFHAMNLVCHIVCVFLVFFLLRKLVKNDWPACAGALLFALHPLQVASVAWVSQLKGIMAALFSFCALLYYVKYAEGYGSPGNRRSKIFYAVALAAFLLAILSKSSAVVVPLIAAVIDRLLLKRGWKAIAFSLGPWLLAALPIALIAKETQITGFNGAGCQLWFRPFVALDAVAYYVYKLLWPATLCIDYGRNPLFIWHHGIAIFSWLVPGSVLLCGIIAKSRNAYLQAGAAIFVLSLLPISGLLPFQQQYYSTIDDRYAYFAIFGAALAASAFMANRRFPGSDIAAAIVLVVLGVKSSCQASTWRNDVALYNHAIRVNPQSGLAYNNLGYYYFTVAGNYAAAEKGYQAAIDRLSDCETAYYNLGLVYERTDRVPAAIAAYTKAVRINPKYGEAQKQLAALWLKSNNSASAAAHFRKALDAFPGSWEIEAALGQSLFQTQLYDSSLLHYSRAVAGSPRNPDLYVKRGIVFCFAEQLDSALAQFKCALQLDSACAQAHFYSGQVYAHRGYSALACEEYQKASLLQPSDSACAHNARKWCGPAEHGRGAVESLTGQE